MASDDLEQRYRADMFDRAKFLIEQYQRLDIIYKRVSTKTKGQEENDQEEPILEEFNLDKDKCLIIEAKESAYQLKKQKFRRLNIIPEICSLYPEYDKVLYLWDLNRLYRRRELQYDFIKSNLKKYGLKVYAKRQQFLVELSKRKDAISSFVYDIMLMTFGYMAEEESVTKSDNVKKSYHKKAGRVYTNKNRLVGRKLKDMQGKKLKLDAAQLDKIEQHIIKCIKAGKTYAEIINIFAKNNIKISLGYINNIKNKYM
jgi:DNA invertase Pin-like site-specific DNA recombinase